jgi:two-component system, NarL family, sensor histidine kinase DegS
MTDPLPTAPAATLGDLSGRLADDLLRLDGELTEVDQLITQAKSEATRHEGRRAAAAEKFAALTPDGDPKERLDQTTSLVTLTKRAALMETQVDVLEGKRRALARYRDALVEYLAAMGALDPSMVLPTGVSPADAMDLGDGDDAPMPAAVSRLVLGAQEDLRREIARAMHDGPAQSLTNIVLQAQIVERLVVRDPTSAAGEVRQLVAMVQHTLDATKSFIFDVRPMVLDDLGLVPTLRRATRERGRRAGIPVEFESMGQDRRLPMDLESGLFRMLDEALAGYLGAAPDHVTLRLDWAEQLEARIGATRAIADARRVSNVDVPEPESGKDLPPALAAMFEQRLEDERQAAEKAVRDSIVALPAGNWREIQGRASSIGVTAELSSDGSEVRLVADLPALETPSEESSP